MHRIRGLSLLPLVAMALLLVCLPGQAKADYAGPIFLDQPQVDPAAPNVSAGKEVVIVHVHASNGNSGPLTVDPALCYLVDENGNQYREPATSSLPALKKTVLAPGESLSGYVAFLVPAGTWPQGAGYEGVITFGWLVPVFGDVNDGYHFYKQIGELKYQGIIGGFSDGNFRPNDPILRQQLAKVLVLAQLRLADENFSPLPGHSTPSPTYSYPLGYLLTSTAFLANLTRLTETSLRWTSGCSSRPAPSRTS